VAGGRIGVDRPPVELSRSLASLVVLERLAELDQEFRDTEARLGDPDLIADQPHFQQVAKR
jgi:hypothetical protein